jgi:signal transduction histidine kinase
VIDNARRLMVRQVRHMVRLVDDLLDVSWIDHGKLELRLQAFTLHEAIENGIEAAQPNLSSRMQQLAVELPETRTILQLDPIRMSQVISNLLNNASKFTDLGGQIRLSLALRDGEARITVQDPGIGIAGDKLGSIFQPFVQLDDPSRQANGGLGLSLSKSIVELHGGTIEAHSDGPGQGSRFTVRLPLPGTAEVPGVPETPEASAGPGAPEASGAPAGSSPAGPGGEPAVAFEPADTRNESTSRGAG